MAVMDDTMSHDGGVSKHRVSKACDRCRLKKSKCDGHRPCNRCKLENQVCLFGERRRSKDKTYPKGYVELLEHQQSLLVVALRQLYQQCGKQAPLSEDKEVPQVHDMLQNLGVFNSSQEYSDSPVSSDEFQFEEDPLKMQWSLDQANKAAELDSSRISSPRLPLPSKPSQQSRFDTTIIDSVPTENYTSYSPQLFPLNLDAMPDAVEFSQSPDSGFATEFDTETVGGIDPKVKAAIEYLRLKSAREQASNFDFLSPFNMLPTDQDEFINNFQDGLFLNTESFY